MGAPRPPKGLLVAAPSSGSGKTVLTLALLRALRNSGYSVSGAKAGPDYIDPAFHSIATGKEAFNLDPWAMSSAQISSLAASCGSDLLLVEAMMGLFDGAADGSGSAADLAEMLSLPVLFVVDAAKQSHSIAALVRGFRDHRPDLNLAGVLLNKVGSARHEALLRNALATIDMPVLGAIHRDACLHLPERHLGLVQAGETDGLEAFIDKAADSVTAQCDLSAIAELFRPVAAGISGILEVSAGLPEDFGQHIAIARDEAFSFIYPHLLMQWRESGRQVSFFSPLADEGPDPAAETVYLPGGYPELHCAKLVAAQKFRDLMKQAGENGKTVYGECGGYMVLGEGIIDKNGQRYPMLGMLNLETSFEKLKLHLGYRKISGLAGAFAGQMLAGHEFHYTTATREEGESLFEVADATGQALGKCGLISGRVMGSYIHLIAQGASVVRDEGALA